MPELHSPHDALIRSMFREKEEAISFFKSTLSEKVIPLLVWEDLKLSNSSYVSPNLKQSHSDLLFQIPLHSGEDISIYILFEHKSYLDTGIYIQLLGYLAEIYRDQIRNKKNLSVVIPFVFYHGEKKWNLGNRFADQFRSSDNTLEEFCQFIPDFQIDLFDLSNINLEKRIESIALKVLLGILQKIRWNDADFYRDLRGIFDLLDGLLNESKRVEILRILLIYISSVRETNPEKIQEAIIQSKLIRYGGEVMTMAEQLRREGKLEDVRNMLKEKIAIEIILRVTGFTKEDLQEAGILKEND